MELYCYCLLLMTHTVNTMTGIDFEFETLTGLDCLLTKLCLRFIFSLSNWWFMCLTANWQSWTLLSILQIVKLMILWHVFSSPKIIHDELHTYLIVWAAIAYGEHFYLDLNRGCMQLLRGRYVGFWIDQLKIMKTEDLFSFLCNCI